MNDLTISVESASEISTLILNAVHNTKQLTKLNPNIISQQIHETNNLYGIAILIRLLDQAKYSLFDAIEPRTLCERIQKDKDFDGILSLLESLRDVVYHRFNEINIEILIKRIIKTKDIGTIHRVLQIAYEQYMPTNPIWQQVLLMIDWNILFTQIQNALTSGQDIRNITQIIDILMFVGGQEKIKSILNFDFQILANFQTVDDMLIWLRMIDKLNGHTCLPNCNDINLSLLSKQIIQAKNAKDIIELIEWFVKINPALINTLDPSIFVSFIYATDTPSNAADLFFVLQRLKYDKINQILDRIDVLMLFQHTFTQSLNEAIWLIRTLINVEYQFSDADWNTIFRRICMAKSWYAVSQIIKMSAKAKHKYLDQLNPNTLFDLLQPYIFSKDAYVYKNMVEVIQIFLEVKYKYLKVMLDKVDKFILLQNIVKALNFDKAAQLIIELQKIGYKF